MLNFVYEFLFYIRPDLLPGFFWSCILGVKENFEEVGYCIHSYSIFHMGTVTFHYGLARTVVIHIAAQMGCP